MEVVEQEIKTLTVFPRLLLKTLAFLKQTGFQLYLYLLLYHYLYLLTSFCSISSYES